MIDLAYDCPRPSRLVSLNERAHWASQQRHKGEWLDGGYWLGQQIKTDMRRMRMRLPLETRCRIRFAADVAEERRRDGHNMALCAKWFIDGLVLAGVFADDDSKHLELGDWEFNVVKRKPLYLHVEITEAPA